MTLGPSQIIHRIKGSPPVGGCSDVSPTPCWVCGFEARRGMPRHAWMGAKFTGQNRVRCPRSGYVCEACVLVTSGRPPDTERMYSHMVEGDVWLRVNKGQKPAMREFLRRPKRAAWFAAIADSGQKHVVPWAPLNSADQPGGRVLFEEAFVDLPRDDAGWLLLDVLTDLLTDGATKDEILTGSWSARAWQLLGPERVATFERAHGERLRGGAWFELAVWLAQRDEAKVAARMAAEKERKREGKRGAARAIADDDGRGDPGPAGGVPADAGVQRPEALRPDRRPPPSGGAAVRESGGVVHVDDALARDLRSERGQLQLFP